MHKVSKLIVCTAALAALAAAGQSGAEEYKLKIPLGLPAMKIPKDNPLTAEKIELGKQLYFDPRLSEDSTVSCATCHDPAKGWSNSDRFATGIRAQVGGRGAPTILNAGYLQMQFWDGRAAHVEGQALGPIENPIEMAMSMPLLIERLNKIPGYREQFQKVFGTDATKESVAKAIGAFERTVLAGNAPYDKFKAGDKVALSEEAQRGMKVFFGVGNCAACHSAPLFTDGAFHNLGIGMDSEKPDLGRYAISKQAGDTGAFRTPSLRDIDKHAPYMHDGRFKTLEEVVDYYDKGGTANDYLDEELFPLKLTAQQKSDLIKFMKEGLASGDYPLIQAPKFPE